MAESGKPKDMKSAMTREISAFCVVTTHYFIIPQEVVARGVLPAPARPTETLNQTAASL
jgi:hypothetical protein